MAHRNRRRRKKLDTLADGSVPYLAIVLEASGTPKIHSNADTLAELDTILNSLDPTGWQPGWTEILAAIRSAVRLEIDAEKTETA